MQLLDSEHYQQLKATGRLPSPQGVAFAIIKLLQSDDYQLGELVRLVQSDPALAGRLLKYSNSAVYGNSRPIVSLNKAVITIGASRVRDLVLGFSILQAYRSGIAGFDFQQFWTRSLAAAIAAQALASHARIAGEESFTIGLLLNIGELALAALFPERFGDILQLAADDPAGRLALEQNAFGTDHRQLGATMLAEWGLPEGLIAAVYHYEVPDAAGLAEGSRTHTLALALHFAHNLAEICVADEHERWAVIPDLFNKAARLGIGPDQLHQLVDEVIAHWREWGHELEIQTRELPTFAHMLSAAPPMAEKQEAATGYRQIAALLVGRDDADSTTLAQQLADAGYIVNRIDNAADGLMVALRDNTALIFVDVRSQDVDGLAFCRSIRASSLGQDSYLVLIARPQDEALLAQNTDTGADDFLLLPVSTQTLRLRLRSAERLLALRDEIIRERRGVVRTADEWAGTHRRLMQAATTDPLTQLHNRRYGMDFLASEWGFAHTNGRPLACFMVDIDHFKQVNDQAGHDAGDAVLATVAETIRSNARTEDLVFRYGGEEFCTICPNADLVVATKVAERIRERVAAIPTEYAGTLISVTISIGIAIMDGIHSSPEEMLHAADTALYRAKQNGRNRVELQALSRQSG